MEAQPAPQWCEVEMAFTGPDAGNAYTEVCARADIAPGLVTLPPSERDVSRGGLSYHGGVAERHDSSSD
jgi:hypothetical protein